MNETFLKICKNCGHRYTGLPPDPGCPRCKSTLWERAGFRQYCQAVYVGGGGQEACSLIVNHEGDHIPWPNKPMEIERGSSEDYAPQVEGETMHLDQKDGQVGVYNKYDVRRTDGRCEPGEKHENCAYFVLDITHDPHAVAALRAYAESCRISHPQLAIDIWATVGSDPEADQDGVDLSLWTPLRTLEEADRG